jgi:spore germination protein
MPITRPHPGPRTMVVLAVLAACAIGVPAAGQDAAAPAASRPAFEEIWAYLVRGEESRLAGTEPITDICYVGAYLSRNGRIVGSIPRPSVTTRGGAKPRIHLVVPETANMALTHFVVDPRYGVRPLLVEDIVRLAQDFDGVQIDFEAVARDDAGAFHDFLRALRLALPAEKMLSIAVPARTKTIADAWEYARIATIVDRMVIMAYDEHWSTSAPGPVASLAWCTSVADFAKTAIPPEKIIMGLPLYGRAWQDKQLARALRFDTVKDLVEQTGSDVGYASATGPSFSYTESVVVSVFFEDARSLGEKLGLYQARGIPAVSFWRIGQGPPEVWTSMDIRERASSGDSAPGAATGPSTGSP